MATCSTAAEAVSGVAGDRRGRGPRPAPSLPEFYLFGPGPAPLNANLARLGRAPPPGAGPPLRRWNEERAQPAEAVRCDQAVRDQLRQGFLALRAEEARPLEELVEEGGAVLANVRRDRFR